MKKVIFEQPADTIPVDELKVGDFIGVEIQNSKAMIIKAGDYLMPVLNNNVAHDVLKFESDAHVAGLKQFTNVYKFDTLTELIEWLVQ